MTVLAANVRWLLDRAAERNGNPYVYGGTWSAANTKRGCDCSALAAHVLNGVLFGPGMTWQRVDPTRGNAWITTESWRPVEVGQRGPFGTITVARPQDIPADAAVKIALHHGPGGGANSHMWVECNGIRLESAGSVGQVTGTRARAITDPYGNDWAYLPGPIVGGVPAPAPAPSGPSYTVRPGDTLARIAAAHGTTVRALIRGNGIPNPDRIDVGQVIALTQPNLPADLTDRELLEQIWDQLRGPGGNGWPQLHGKTIVDALASLPGSDT